MSTPQPNQPNQPDQRDGGGRSWPLRWVGRLAGAGWRHIKTRYDQAHDQAGERARLVTAAVAAVRQHLGVLLATATAVAGVGMGGVGYVTAHRAADTAGQLADRLAAPLATSDAVTATLDTLAGRVDALADAQQKLADATRAGDAATAGNAAQEVRALSRRLGILVAQLDAQVASLRTRITTTAAPSSPGDTGDTGDTGAATDALRRRLDRISTDLTHLSDRVNTLADALRHQNAATSQTGERLDALAEQIATIRTAMSDLTARVDALDTNAVHAAGFAPHGALTAPPVSLGTMPLPVQDPATYLVTATVSYTQPGGCRIRVQLTVDGATVRDAQSEGTAPVTGGSIAVAALVHLTAGTHRVGLVVDGCTTAQIGESVVTAARTAA